ncbi:MAG TPA: hypothetical protein PKK00_09795 [Bacteroidales bacterium]|nr:hypothetical protein [Bacteroidales bacterium]HPS17517.1 hypothetical protein [Bacteroidales bacterium]
MKKFILLFFYLTIANFYLNAQENEKAKSKINISTDIVSRYIWRGLDYGTAPSIQPTFAYLKSGFELGIWGAFNTKGTYHEADLYAKYTLKNFTIACTDYFIHNETFPNNTHYFKYDSKTTNHAIEGSLQYKGTEKFPISVLAAAYVYGNDRAWGYDAEKDSTLENYYSSYFELGYTLKCKENTFDLFMGMTPAAGAYGNTFGVVNLGVTGYRTIEFTDKFTLPVKASVIANPQASNLYFVIGFTL